MPWQIKPLTCMYVCEVHKQTEGWQVRREGTGLRSSDCPPFAVSKTGENAARSMSGAQRKCPRNKQIFFSWYSLYFAEFIIVFIFTFLFLFFFLKKKKKKKMFPISNWSTTYWTFWWWMFMIMTNEIMTLSHLRFLSWHWAPSRYVPARRYKYIYIYVCVRAYACVCARVCGSNVWMPCAWYLLTMQEMIFQYLFLLFSDVNLFICFRSGSFLSTLR